MIEYNQKPLNVEKKNPETLPLVPFLSIESISLAVLKNSHFQLSFHLIESFLRFILHSSHFIQLLVFRC